MSTTTTAKKPNLFASAKKVEAPSSSSKTKQEIIFADDEFPGLDKAIKNLKETKEIIAQKTTEKESWYETVITAGKKMFVKLYQQKKSRPDSFVMKTAGGAKITFMPKDAYAGFSIKADEADAVEQRINSLREKYGEDIVTTTTTYVIDPDMLDKYGEAISEAILSSKKIEEGDKFSIILCKQKHQVTPGSIDRYMQFSEDERDEFLFNIQPQFALR